MSKRSRREQPRRAPNSPAADRATPSVEAERLLLDQIAAGALDQHLTAIADAIRARHELLHTIKTHKALAMLSVGDRVRINHQATPRYLHGVHGVHGVITELDDDIAVVCVHRPIGRFTSGEIRCPPLVLDRLNLAA